MTPHEEILELKARMGRSIVGQGHMIERLLIGLIANGNLLVEGLPGLAKTRAVKALAKNLDAEFSRVQFTPDLLPSDVTDTEVYHQAGGTGEFRFEPGPIFANIVLADEINRAPAKVQSSLLEAMEERQVTVAKTTRRQAARARRAESEAAYFGRFETAARSGDPLAAANALSAWLDRWDGAPAGGSLSAFAETIGDRALAEEVKALTTRLYARPGSGETEPWSGAALVKAVARARAARPERRRVSRMAPTALDALNPSTPPGS